MTRAERMTAAIRREPVDRVPHTTYNFHPFAGSRHGRDERYAKLLERVVETAGMLCKCGVPFRGPSGSSNAAVRVERTATHTVQTRIVPTPKGDLRSVTVKPHDQPSYVTEHLLKTDADIERYLSLPWDLGEPDLGPPSRMKAELAGRGLLYVSYPDPFYSAASLFDFGEFAVRCLTDPQPVRRLVDALMERSREQVRALAEAVWTDGVLFYTAGPEVATPPLLPPWAFAKWIVPYHQELVELLHRAGHLVAMHCHGRVRDVLDGVLACGFDALEPLEPPPQGDITLAELLDRTAGRMALMGYIQDQDFHLAAPGCFRRVVAEIAELVGGRTGYLMSPTCTPFQFPPSERFCRNYEAWLAAADELLGDA